MNAEDCPIHRALIDQPGAGGVYYPWICPCEPQCARCKGSGIDPEYSLPAEGPSEYSMGEPPVLEPCVDCQFLDETGFPYRPVGHFCGNCEGVDPDTCLYNPRRSR